MAHTCRGTVNLAGAFIDTIDATNFVITNGPSQVYHLRALNEVERQRWVTTLELAKSKAIKNLESGKQDVRESRKGVVSQGGCLLKDVVIVRGGYEMLKVFAGVKNKACCRSELAR